MELNVSDLLVKSSRVQRIKKNNITNEPNNFAVIRSTVISGTSGRLECYFMPEFLTERNYMDELKQCGDWIFGLKIQPI